jgi:hypothetical protein
MNVLHITNHIGTTRNVENVFSTIQQDKAFRLHTEKCHFPLYIHLTQANDIFNQYMTRESFREYHTLIFTDICMYARPFLQNIEDHSMNIILYVTNRFDWGAWYNGDTNYNALYAAVSKHPRVRFIADNRYDQYYAGELHGIRFFYPDLVRLTPKIQPYSPRKIHFHNAKLFIYNRGTFLRHYQHWLHGIEYDVYGYDGYSRYKDENHIAEYMAYLHLPYQTNIQSLWENLGFQIIYFIPSKSFLTTILFDEWYHWEEKYRKPFNVTYKSIELSEWYQEEHTDLFVFFDSWEDLTVKYRFYLENNTALIEKKKKIYDYLTISNRIHLEKWGHLLKTCDPNQSHII